MPRALLVTLSLLLFSGCKLAVVVVEGGEVQSVASGTCAAGTVCIHEVADTNYAESFTAVPDSGWEFVKWNSGGGFFCSNSPGATCVTLLAGTAGIPVIEALVATDQTFYIMPIFAEIEIPNTMNVDGKVWKQPAAFTDLSWNNINAVCPLVSAGDCSGTLNGVIMDDWRWASVADLAPMLSTYGASIPPSGGVDEELNSTWAPAFFAAGWQETFTAPFERFTSGWLRDEGFDSSQGTNGGIEQSFTGSEDAAWSGNNDPKTQSLPGRGGWFYHSP